MSIIKSLQSGVTLCFQFDSAAAPAATTLRLTSKLFKLHLRDLRQKIYRSGKMYWMTSPWPWPKVAAVASISKKFACLHDKVRTTHYITTKQCSFIVLVTIITWLDFGKVLLETVILAFFKKFWTCFVNVKHYFGHISGMVGPIDVKRIGIALVGYWV